MSRVAGKPVSVPRGVELKFSPNLLEIKGSKGILSQIIDVDVEIKEKKENDLSVLTFTPRSQSRRANAMSGTMRAIVHNMVVGVSEGFSTTLELVGVGYRVQSQGNKLNLNLGFSHPVIYDLPKGITAETPNNTTILVKGIDKQLVGQVAAELRSLRPPEPYKGKGIKYAGEKILRKESKKK